MTPFVAPISFHVPYNDHVQVLFCTYFTLLQCCTLC
jgi:hypothetical protein